MSFHFKVNLIFNVDLFGLAKLVGCWPTPILKGDGTKSLLWDYIDFSYNSSLH